MNNAFKQFDNGKLVIGRQAHDLAAIPWTQHKDFPGVYLKSVVPADKTGGRFSCHMVKIDPRHKIGMHSHMASIELHEVVAGRGKCVNGGVETDYFPGCVAVLDANSQHEVVAGDEGLFLFAKFINL